MGRKKLLITLGVIGGILGALTLCAFIYVQLGLYKPSISDDDLIGNLFPPGDPGFSDVKIIRSEGEGIRRIPREIEFSVQLESYPKPVICQGEIFLAMGDPMIISLRWRTVQCAGQHRYVELAQIALDYGFEYSECHDEMIALLLARWVKLGLISMDDVNYPAVNDAVTPLVSNPDLLTLQPAMDAGLFDTSNIIVRADVKSENESSQGLSIVLRCDGTAELYMMNSWLLKETADLSYDDYILPETLVPFTPLTEK